MVATLRCLSRARVTLPAAAPLLSSAQLRTPRKKTKQCAPLLPPPLPPRKLSLTVRRRPGRPGKVARRLFGGRGGGEEVAALLRTARAERRASFISAYGFDVAEGEPVADSGWEYERL